MGNIESFLKNNVAIYVIAIKKAVKRMNEEYIYFDYRKLLKIMPFNDRIKLILLPFFA